MNNFIKRTLTGIVFIVVMAGAIVIHPVAFGVLFLGLTILGLLEFYRLVRSEDVIPNAISGLAGGITVYGLILLVAIRLFEPDVLMISLLVIPLVFITELFSFHEKPFTNASYTLVGIIYIAIPFALLNLFYITDPTDGNPFYLLVLGYFIIQWVYDTSAYLTGKAAGRHPLFERVSPQKTWEGLLGGLVVGVVSAWILSRFFSYLSTIQWIYMAIVIIVFSTFGDLTESMLKRSVQTKDSGRILPGHGGILDRFDGVLFSAPAVAIYIHFLFN